MPELARGTLGSHLREVAEAIAALDFNFPPGADMLARLSGAQLTPQRMRIAEKLAKWSEAISQKKSRWAFATSLMHHTVSEAGLIGKARASIEAGRGDAVELAYLAIDQLSTTNEIEDRATEYSTSINKQLLQLHPKGIEYLHRHFNEALGFLSAWIVTFEQEKTDDHRSDERLRTTIGNLNSRLGKARVGLTMFADDDTLDGAVAKWLVVRIDEAKEALTGADTGNYVTIEEAITADRDLLPASARRSASEEGLSLEALVDVFDRSGVPEPKTAYAQARKQGAFETADAWRHAMASM